MRYVTLCFIGWLIAGTPTVPRAASAYALCPATPVHTTNYHGKTFSLRGVPWIATSSHAILGFTIML